MLINKKPSKPSIVSKSKDLAGTRKCVELTRSIINLQSQQHVLQETNKMNRLISLKQSFQRNPSENNRSEGKEPRDFRKVAIRNKKLTESKNSKGSKSSQKSFVNKVGKEGKMVRQLEKLIDLVRRCSMEEMPAKLQGKLFEMEMESEEAEKVIFSKIAIFSKILVHKMMHKEKTMEQSYLIKDSQESQKEEKEKETEGAGNGKKEYDNFMDFEFSANDLMNNPKQTEMSDCSYNSYIAQPNEGECVGYKRLKEDVQNKLKLDLNKLKLNK